MSPPDVSPPSPRARRAPGAGVLLASFFVLAMGAAAAGALKALDGRLLPGQRLLIETALVAACGLGAGAALALWNETRWRREQAERKRRHLERGASRGGHGVERTLEGTLVLLRPPGDGGEPSPSTWLASALVHFPIGGRPCELPPGVEAALDTDEGRIHLDGPLLVALGSAARRGSERGRPGEWRSVREGDRVLTRGLLLEEAIDSGRGSPFRQTAQRSRLVPTVLGSGGSPVLPLVCLRNPRFLPRWPLLAGTALLPAAISVFSVIAVHATSDGPPQAACTDGAMEALEASDPWKALTFLERCPAPLLEGRARWMVGDFAGASEAFDRSAAHEPTVSEVEAHALGGRLDRAAAAARRMARAWSLPSTGLVHDLDCIADAFEARTPAGQPAAGRLDRADGTLCRVLARDLRIVRGQGDPLDASIKPVASGQVTLDALLALLPLTDPRRPQRFDGDLPSIDFAPGAGRDPRLRHRRRPLALHAAIVGQLQARGPEAPGRGKLAGQRGRLAAMLSADLALMEAYAGRSSEAMRRLDPVRDYVDAHSVADDAALYSRDREMVLCAAWASFQAGTREDALALAHAAGDPAASAQLARWLTFRDSSGPFDPRLWAQEEPLYPGRELFELASAGDARPVVDWLRAHNHDGRGFLDRLAPRFTLHTDELERFVQRYPVRCWACGLGALFEQTADRRALARRLNLASLEARLGEVAGRVVEARMGRDLAVPLLLLEQYRDY